MYETIEAIYERGKITPLHDKLHIKRAKVLLTILKKLDTPGPQGVPLEKLTKFKGLFKKFPEGLKYQRDLRNEW